jgi:hypothetical protein
MVEFGGEQKGQCMWGLIGNVVLQFGQVIYLGIYNTLSTLIIQIWVLISQIAKGYKRGIKGV